jgi:spermidine/putrescine transport system ATP-binding protein
MPGGEVRLVELVKRFGDTTAVDGVTLTIEPGEFFSLLGPSGCGKTTSLRMIAGFEQPTSGRILLDGTDVSQTPPHRRDVNTVFQNYALFPHLSVFDNVAFGLRFKDLPKDERRRKVHEALALVRLEGFDRRRPSRRSR